MLTFINKAIALHLIDSFLMTVVQPHLIQAQSLLKYGMIAIAFNQHTLISEINARGGLTWFELTRGLINANSSLLKCFY